jgi:hypothetical protein
MKNFFNYSVALAALLMLTMNACTEDCEYSPAPIPNNNDIVVSFSSDADNNMEVAPTDAKEMTIEVSRENTDSEVSVPLKVMRNDENIFQIPGSVTFAAGKKTATVKITFPEIKEGVVSLVSGKLLLRIRKYLINNIFRGQTPVHDLKCLHLQSVS